MLFSMIATAHVTVIWLCICESFCQTNRAAGLAKHGLWPCCLDEEGGNKGAKEGVRMIPKPWIQIDFDSFCAAWVDEQRRTDG